MITTRLFSACKGHYQVLKVCFGRMKAMECLATKWDDACREKEQIDVGSVTGKLYGLPCSSQMGLAIAREVDGQNAAAKLHANADWTIVPFLSGRMEAFGCFIPASILFRLPWELILEHNKLGALCTRWVVPPSGHFVPVGRSPKCCMNMYCATEKHERPARSKTVNLAHVLSKCNDNELMERYFMGHS
ncbi:hypothetical protein ACP4OV_027287 [Aristida adscensionis]